MIKYDVLIVGAGPYGCTFARFCKDFGLRVKVIDKRNHIAGNTYDEKDEETGIIVQKYGAHIFRTSNDYVWNFLNRFTSFKPFVHVVKANYKGKTYSLPFNMNTFKEIYGCETIEEAKKIIEEKTSKYKNIEPKNLEEHALKLAGEDIYNILIKGYTEKQWKKSCSELPPTIMRRIKFRYEYNNDYFSEKYEGIPEQGFTHLFENMLDGIEVELNSDYLQNKEKYNEEAKYVIYCGQIDKFFNYEFGKLSYRSLKFEEKKFDCEFFQETAVTNYTDNYPEYTRTIEHKHFLNQKSPKTIVTFEYPKDYDENSYPFYTVNDEENNKKYEMYKLRSLQYPMIKFGGVMGKYKYLDMNEVIKEALFDAENFIGEFYNENKKV